jgi:hypothetical protein
MALMEVTMTTEILKTNFTRDLAGLNISKQTNVIIDGVTYKGPVVKATVNKRTRNLSNEEVVNTNFNTELETFTGITNFVSTRLPV